MQDHNTTGIDIPNANISLRNDSSDGSSEDFTHLSSSLPLEYDSNYHENSPTNKHSNSFSILETSLPSSFDSKRSSLSALDTSLPSSFENNWLFRALSLNKMASLFIRSPKESHNDDDDMPVNFPDTKKLEKEKVIKIRSNRLKKIPNNLYRLKSLEELRITRNKFKPGDGINTLPVSFSKLDKLKILDLRGNPLKEMLTIGHLTALVELTLESCDLCKVPLINDLPNLDRVILDNNKILAPSFSETSKITYLTLVNNNITNYPEELPPNLTNLDLSENEIQVIPESLLTKNSSLKKLNLRENLLRELPNTLCSLRNLKLLDVSKNQLRLLPEKIGDLPLLLSLNISYNELTTLPKSVINLNKTHLLCGENPLQKPPIEVGLQGLSSIKNYFEQLDASKEVTNKRLKLMLLGDARAGKTFLAKALSTCKEPDRCEDETIGIDCFHMKDTLNENETLEVLIVDCAGQKKYLLTHQLFLTTGIIFAVVVNLHAYRTREYHEKIGYWIDLIIAKVPNAVIQIVPTHLDLIANESEIIDKCTSIVEEAHNHIFECKNEVRKMSKTIIEVCNGDGEEDEDDDEELIEPVLPNSLKFLKLDGSLLTETRAITKGEHEIHIIPVSSRQTLPGLQLLRDQIVAIAGKQELCPNIHRCIPESWMKLEQYCLKEREMRVENPIVTLKQLEEGAKLFHTQQDCREALRLADSMGHILFYEHFVQDLILLDPRWLFNLMKLLFTHHANRSFKYNVKYQEKFDLFESEFISEKDLLINRAFLSRKLLRSIWDDYIQDEVLFEQVVFLFEICDLFYKLPSDKLVDTTYLVTWFLSNERPKDIVTPDYSENKLIVTRFESTGALPFGFFQRFITKLYAKHVFTQCFPWNSGFKGLVSNDGVVMCEYERYDYMSRITFVSSASSDYIHHMWKTIIIIIKVLEEFMKDWRGIKHVFHSVCPSCYTEEYEAPFLWRLDPSKVYDDSFKVCCYKQAKELEKWTIFPPIGILSNDANEKELERLNAPDMNKEMGNKQLNKLANLLSPHVTQVANVLEVIIGEKEQQNMSSVNLVLDLITLWKRKLEKPTKRKFLECMKNIIPYPVDVIEELMRVVP